MKLFNKKITSRKHSPNDKHYHAVVDVKRGLKSSDSLSFMTSDIHTGVLTLELIDGDLPYNVNGCKVSATISCPDSTVLEIPCEMLDDNIVEIHLGIEGTYQEGVYTFDLKIDRGNARIVGIPTITYNVLSSIVEKSVDDDKFQILDKLISQTKDRLDRFDVAMSGMTSDSEVREARDGENLLYDRLKRDLDYSKSIDAKVEQVAESVTELESNVGNIVQSNLTQLDNRITQVDNRVTQEVNAINSSIADLNLKVDHMGDMSGSAGATTSYVKILSERDWLQEDGLYYVDINHTLLTEMVMVSMIDIDSGDSIAPTFRVLANDMVRVMSNYPCKASVSIINSNVEVKGANFAQIDDELVSPYRTWSSEKIDNELNTHKANITSLQTKVNNGQNFKLTTDGGAYIATHKDATEDARNLDNKFAGWYDIYNCTGTLPSDLNADDNNVFLEVKRRTNDYCIQYLYDVRTTRSWVRNRNKGVWSTWVSIQNHKVTQDNGHVIRQDNIDLNTLTKTGFYYSSSPTNSPMGITSSWYIDVKAMNSGTYVYQKAIRNSAGNDVLPKYERNMHNGTWTAWREL